MSNYFYISYGALWILIILHSLILLGLVRVVYQLQQTGMRAASMESGQEAPAFSAVDLSGTPIKSTDFAGRLKVLLFVSPDCPACTSMLEDDIEFLEHKAQGNVIVICQAGRKDCARLVEQRGINMPIIADVDGEISRLYEISSVPTAVFVNANNRVQSYGKPQYEEVDETFEKAAEVGAPGVP